MNEDAAPHLSFGLIAPTSERTSKVQRKVPENEIFFEKNRRPMMFPDLKQHRIKSIRLILCILSHL